MPTWLGARLLKEKFLPSFVWDEIKFEREGGIHGEPVEELILIQVHRMDPTKTIRIGTIFPKDSQENFQVFLRKNIDVFA